MRAIHRDTRAKLSHNPTGELVKILTKKLYRNLPKFDNRNKQV